MKKIIFVVLCLQMTLLSVLFITVAKQQSRQQLLYDGVTIMSLNTTEVAGDVSSQIIAAANQTNITLAVYIHPDKQTQYILTNDVTLAQRLSIKIPEFTNTNAFISSQQTGEALQKGRFRLFDQSLLLKIYPIEGNQNYQPSGLYYLFTTDQSQINQFTALLTPLGISVNPGMIDTQAQLWMQQLLQHWDWLLLNLLVCLALVVIILHDGFVQQRTRYLLSLQGQSKWQIWLYSITRLRWPFVSAVLLTICLCLLWQWSQVGTAYSLTVIGLCLLAIALTGSVFMFLLSLISVLNQGVLADVSGKRPVKRLFALYLGLKLCFLALMAGLAHVYVLNQTVLTTALAETADWEKMRGIYTPVQSYVGQDKRKIEATNSSKLKNLYEEMRLQGGFLIVSRDYLPTDSRDEKTFLAEHNPRRINPDERKVILDLNYLTRHPVTSQAHSIADEVIWDENVRNVLVPQQYKYREAELNRLFLADFTFGRVDLMAYYEEFSGLPITAHNTADLAVNLIYVDDKQPYFSYGNDLPLWLPNAFAIVETGNTSPLDYSWYFSGNVYFEAHGDPYATLFPAIQRANTEELIRSVSSVYHRKGFIIQLLNENQVKIGLFVALLIGSSFLLTYTLTALYFKRNQRRIMIAHCHGDSYGQIHRRFFTLLLSLNGVLLVVIALQADVNVLVSFCCYVLLEALLIYGLHRYYEKRQLAENFKRGS